MIFMKNIIYVLSFAVLASLFAPALNAQSIEQISYIPVKRGNYQQLMVKKKAIFGGNLTVTNTLKSNATFLNLTSSGGLALNNNPGINVNQNVFLSGTNLKITGDVKVYGQNILTIRGGNSTTIGRLSNSGSVNVYSQNVIGGDQQITIQNLYIDGLQYPSGCSYTWRRNVETTGGGKYTVLQCD